MTVYLCRHSDQPSEQFYQTMHQVRRPSCYPDSPKLEIKTNQPTITHTTSNGCCLHSLASGVRNTMSCLSNSSVNFVSLTSICLKETDWHHVVWGLQQTCMYPSSCSNHMLHTSKLITCALSTFTCLYDYVCNQSTSLQIPEEVCSCLFICLPVYQTLFLSICLSV